MNKPFTIAIEETKQLIVKILNEAQLHPYFIDSIMKDLYQETHSLYIQTVQQEKAEYDKSLNENEETKSETTKK